MIRHTLQQATVMQMEQTGPNHFESLGKIKPTRARKYVDPWRLDPDPYGYHGIDLERRLDEMQLLPQDLL